MGHQTRFFLSLTDTNALEKQLLSLEDTFILHDRSRGPYPRVLDSTNLIENEHRWLFFSLVRAVDLDLVVTNEVKTQGYWCVNDLSPVIEFSRCSYPDERWIRSGRLYYNDNYYDDVSRTLVMKPLGFREWAKKVLAKARRSLIYDKDLFAYIGEEANEMRKSGVEFRDF